MTTRNKIGVTLLIIGGVLMIASSAIGSIGVYEFLHEYVINLLPPDLSWLIPILDTCLVILRWIADFGGGAVILGAIFVALGQYRLGKWLTSIGLTFGTLGLIIWLISNVTQWFGVTVPYISTLEGFFTYNTGMQFVGVVTAIIGKNLAKKPKKPKEEEEAEITVETREGEIEPPLPFQNIFCPECGASLPFNAEFCSECGHTIDRTKI
jgi:hypothetical protein